ncbi:hypothetical protein Zmor_002452 [Zophobas morio]|uniref:CCHC-type domain-containing protein n=1 Tax=Zophobas morio TaxID=2755281 RepID=A0AA38MTN5_9CUCU|nr:hypothetical protein Zmor_002452 [Zophobas morio]
MGRPRRQQSRESPSPQTSDHFSRTESRETTSSIDRLTEVMTTFIQQAGNRRPSYLTKGEVVPYFNPDDREQNAESWCNKVDELSEIFKWPEDATIYYALSKLRGLAETWYRGQTTLKSTWGEWKERIKTAFPSKRNFYEDLVNMMRRRKRPEETYDKYFYEKNAMLTGCKIVGSDAVSCIIGGIDDVVAKTGATAGNHQTPESLFQYLSAINGVSTTPRPSTSRNYSHPHSSTSKSYSHLHEKPERFGSSTNGMSERSAAHCYHCGKNGHYSKYCPNRRARDAADTVRCTYCRGRGHLEANCFRKENDTQADKSIS